MNNIYLSGALKRRVASRLGALIAMQRPQAIGMATAFLSINGAQTYDGLVKTNDAQVSRVVAGLSGAITHPGAIEYLLEKGHNVRFGEFKGGIFHPKLLVGGNRFLKSGKLVAPICGYVGSANFTAAGLGKNLEVMLATKDPKVAKGVADAFRVIWAEAKPISKEGLQSYARSFVRAQIGRTLADLEFLNVVDSEDSSKSVKRQLLIPPNFSSAVWAGLQSFTGEHAFQVEFPRTAGEALSVLLGTASGKVPIECVDDEVRTMTFRYYVDNGMYRLNVPNSMPLVNWARANRSGALLVWRNDDQHDILHAEIIRGRRFIETAARSKALGSWGHTRTREYGWY